MARGKQLHDGREKGGSCALRTHDIQLTQGTAALLHPGFGMPDRKTLGWGGSPCYLFPSSAGVPKQRLRLRERHAVPAEPFKPDADNSAAGSSIERARPVSREGLVSAVPLPVQNSIHSMNDTANLTYPGSRRVYIPGRLHPDVQVPLREILLSDTLLPDGTAHPNDPVRVYDCSGPWGDAAYEGTAEQGLPPCAPRGSEPAAMWRRWKRGRAAASGLRGERLSRSVITPARVSLRRKWNL